MTDILAPSSLRQSTSQRYSGTYARTFNALALWGDVMFALSGGSKFKDSIDCSLSPNYPAGSAGDWYYVSVAGFIGGGAGKAVEVGDTITCIADNDGGTEAVVGTSWYVSQVNMIPTTVAVLRTGTNNTDFVSAKTLKDQGITTAAATIIALAGGTTQQLLLTNTGAQHGLSIAGATVGSGIVFSGSQGYGIDIGSTTVNGIRFSGTVTSGINFAPCTLVAGQESAAISMGTWSTPVSVTGQTEHFVPIQVNLASNTSIAKNISAARFRVDTSAANTLTAVYAMQMRNTIAHDVASAYTCHASMNVGTMAVITGSMAVSSFYLEGTGTITPAGSNPIDVTNITNVHSGTGVSNCLNVCNNTASAVGTVATLSNLAGVVTDMLYINNANTATSAIHLTAGTLTNVINVAGAATTSCMILVNAATASTCVAPNTSAINALTAKIAVKIMVGGSVYWIPAFSCTDGTGATFN